MRQFILSLLACLCLTAYSQTTSQADLLVEEAQKLESKQDYPTAITKLKQADELYVKTGKTQSAERATCPAHSRPLLSESGTSRRTNLYTNGSRYAQDHTGRNKYQIHFLPEQHRTLLPDCCKRLS